MRCCSVLSFFFDRERETADHLTSRRVKISKQIPRYALNIGMTSFITQQNMPEKKYYALESTGNYKGTPLTTAVKLVPFKAIREQIFNDHLISLYC